MKTRIMFLTACLALLSLTAWAADVTGKWVAQVPGRDGQTQETTINLKAEGDKLTGTISGRGGDTQIQDGKVSGDDVSFVVVREFQGNSFKLVYKGKVTGADEIKFTRTIEGGQGPPPVEFTAKRAK